MPDSVAIARDTSIESPAGPDFAHAATSASSNFGSSMPVAIM